MSYLKRIYVALLNGTRATIHSESVSTVSILCQLPSCFVCMIICFYFVSCLFYWFVSICVSILIIPIIIIPRIIIITNLNFNC